MAVPVLILSSCMHDVGSQARQLHGIQLAVSAAALPTNRTQDNRVCVLAIPKAELGEHWSCLFRGDSRGARCMQPPYTLSGAQRALSWLGLRAGCAEEACCRPATCRVWVGGSGRLCKGQLVRQPSFRPS